MIIIFSIKAKFVLQAAWGGGVLWFNETSLILQVQCFKFFLSKLKAKKKETQSLLSKKIFKNKKFLNDERFEFALSECFINSENKRIWSSNNFVNHIEYAECIG